MAEEDLHLRCRHQSPFRSPISPALSVWHRKCPRLNRLVVVFRTGFNEFRMIARKIVSFADIRGQIVKFPRSILLRSMASNFRIEPQPGSRIPSTDIRVSSVHDR